MAVVEILALLAGFAVMVIASQRAVGIASELAVGAQISPFIIGFTILALGTDLPEIANSIAASLSGHGDINVGDSVGSAATQVTLVLGILGIWLGPLKLPDSNAVRPAVFTVIALATLSVLISDGHIGRTDAIVMLLLWAVGSASIYRQASQQHQLTLPEPTAPRLPLVAKLAGWFIALGVAATVALWAVVQLAERLDAPEFIVGFFLASLGTSLPELVFDVTAIRRGSIALAIGDVVGSSFIDATASVAIGPLISPTPLTRDIVLRGTVVSTIALAFVALVLSRITEHDWRSGTILLFVYGAFFVAML